MLHSGKIHQALPENKSISIKYICNMYLEHQQSRASDGQIKTRHISDQKILLRDFVSFIGPNSLIGNIATINIQNYVSKLIKLKKSANTINNRIAVIKSLMTFLGDFATSFYEIESLKIAITNYSINNAFG
jgi:site-specific recombinase XerD